MSQACEERGRRPRASRGSRISNGCLSVSKALFLVLISTSLTASVVLVVIFSMYHHELITQQAAIVIIVMHAVAGFCSILLYFFPKRRIDSRPEWEKRDEEQHLHQEANKERRNPTYTAPSDGSVSSEVVSPPPRVPVREGTSLLDQSTSTEDLLPRPTRPSRPYSMWPFPQPSDDGRVADPIDDGMRESSGIPTPPPTASVPVVALRGPPDEQSEQQPAATAEELHAQMTLLMNEMKEQGVPLPWMTEDNCGADDSERSGTVPSPSSFVWP
ncbi:hypothetical protein MMC30_004039 [Trapelia coarctata]|nr:hypothetical protein [Trapelia coarctata]